MLRKKMLLVALLAGLMAFAAPTSAMALFEIDVNGFIVADGSAFDGNPAPNRILATGGVLGVPLFPGISGSVDAGLTNAPGGPAVSLLDLTWNVDAVGNTGNTLTILASTTGYTFPSAGTPATLTSLIGGTTTTAGSVTAQQWVAPNNVIFQIGAGTFTPAAQGPFGLGAFSDARTVNFTSTTPYSITERLILTVGAGGVTTGDFASQVSAAVPEPGILILLGMGLGAVGVLSRRIKLQG